MKRFRFYLDSGRSIVVTCEDATFTHDDNRLTGFTLVGVKHNNLEFLDKDSIVAVVALGPINDDAEDAEDAE